MILTRLEGTCLSREGFLQDYNCKEHFCTQKDFYKTGTGKGILSIARLLQDQGWKEHFCPQQDFYKTRTGNGIFAHSRIFTRLGLEWAVFHTARFLQDQDWKRLFCTQQDFYKAGTGKTFLPTAGYLQNREFISIKKDSSLTVCNRVLYNALIQKGPCHSVQKATQKILSKKHVRQNLASEFVRDYIKDRNHKLSSYV